MPITNLTVENAFAHYVQRVEPSLDHLLDGHGIRESEVPMEWLELAYRYPAAIKFLGRIHGEEEGKRTEDPATAIPDVGSVAPRVQVRECSKIEVERPISDFFSNEFVLFSGPTGKHWLVAADVAGIRAVQLAFKNNDHVAESYGVEPDGPVLVRPDGFVAWSSRDAPMNYAKAAVFLQSVMSLYAIRIRV